MPKLKEKNEPSYLKVPPQNLEAEQTVLGGILINNDAINQVMDILSPDEFYREGHVSIFEGMVELYSNDDPIDIISLSQLVTLVVNKLAVVRRNRVVVRHIQVVVRHNRVVAAVVDTVLHMTCLFPS